MTGFRQPVFLSDADQPTNKVRCPVHGFIHYSPNERTILGHRVVQRLRYIRQLALTELVYPGANHSRLEHSLGVMEVATRAFDMLAQKHGDRLESEFKTVAGFKKNPLAVARQLLRVAALLHDVGHAPFSHAAESAVHEELGHEGLSIELITNNEFLKPVLDGLYGEGFSTRVGQILQGPPALPPQLEVLKSIVAGEMDADRSDYLVRDSHHCGVAYGEFEYRRLIECITLDGEPGKLELALQRDGLHAFEALILARYQMNTQVYYHRLRRIYDHYLIQYHLALGKETFDTPEKIVGENDVTMLARIMNDARHDKPQSLWAKRIVNRNHHKLIFEPGIQVVGGHQLKSAQKAFEAVKAKYDKFDFVEDIPSKPIRIHRLLMPHEELKEGVDLMLLSAVGERRPVVSSSQVFSTLPKSFRQIRLFGDVEDRGTRKEIAEFAKKKWEEAGGVL